MSGDIVSVDEENVSETGGIETKKRINQICKPHKNRIKSRVNQKSVALWRSTFL